MEKNLLTKIFLQISEDGNKSAFKSTSLFDLSFTIGKSRQTITRWVKAAKQNKYPNIVSILKICKYYAAHFGHDEQKIIEKMLLQITKSSC